MMITDHDTPTVLIDLDLVEANVWRWQEHYDRHRIKNRPHSKTHKLPQRSNKITTSDNH